jgi:hypothetical protein
MESSQTISETTRVDPSINFLDYRLVIGFVIIVVLITFIILVWLFLDANSQTNKINNNTALLSTPVVPTETVEAKNKCLNDPLCKEVEVFDKFGRQNKLIKVFTRGGKGIETFDNYVFLSKYKWEFNSEFSLVQPGTVRIEKGKIYKLDFIPKKVFGNFKSGLYSQYEITSKNKNSILSENNRKNVYHHFSNFELPWKNLDFIWVLYE